MWLNKISINGHQNYFVFQISQSKAFKNIYLTEYNCVKNLYELRSLQNNNDILQKNMNYRKNLHI